MGNKPTKALLELGFYMQWLLRYCMPEDCRQSAGVSVAQNALGHPVSRHKISPLALPQAHTPLECGLAHRLALLPEDCRHCVSPA